MTPVVLIVTGFSSCFRPLTASLLFIAAPLPLGAQFLADLILRPARSRRYFTNSTGLGTSLTVKPISQSEIWI
jgi:hypothetical protein